MRIRSDCHDADWSGMLRASSWKVNSCDTRASVTIRAKYELWVTLTTEASRTTNKFVFPLYSSLMNCSPINFTMSKVSCNIWFADLTMYPIRTQQEQALCPRGCLQLVLFSKSAAGGMIKWKWLPDLTNRCLFMKYEWGELRVGNGFWLGDRHPFKIVTTQEPAPCIL